MDPMILLDRCRVAQREVDALRDRLTRLRAVVTKSTGTLDLSGGRSTAENDHMAAYAARMDEVERLIQRRIREQAEEEIAVSTLVDDVLTEHGQESDVIVAYYIERMTCAAIAVRLHVGVARVKQLKQNGRDRLSVVNEAVVDKLLPEEYLIDVRGKEKERLL